MKNESNQGDENTEINRLAKYPGHTGAPREITQITKINRFFKFGH